MRPNVGLSTAAAREKASGPAALSDCQFSAARMCSNSMFGCAQSWISGSALPTADLRSSAHAPPELLVLLPLSALYTCSGLVQESPESR
jgi:hypothetical protein